MKFLSNRQFHVMKIEEENFEEIKNKLDPNRSMFFLFSLDDNPNWDMQEFIVYDGDKSSDESNIETAINGHYSIY